MTPIASVRRWLFGGNGRDHTGHGGAPPLFARNPPCIGGEKYDHASEPRAHAAVLGRDSSRAAAMRNARWCLQSQVTPSYNVSQQSGSVTLWRTAWESRKRARAAENWDRKNAGCAPVSVIARVDRNPAAFSRHDPHSFTVTLSDQPSVRFIFLAAPLAWGSFA